ncbi:BTAD domain-containing putative transcriptional regulator [Sphaerisporangium sp. TRM90804]|uniref:AfsR/SARP family transcriptional regulator n=1 Tax=Sphaerisporangium sp. TRM90804 TaxID=3031113 RepID=UPI002449FCCB|nr:BTAD domain-containing putative transcriptional regulator [Sphaerisporangium sp. TRM90804]MDH2424005.1 BTAD domain-containing putative transcriptional regulator [Sphaerisporangium sp. TRM90804]
MDFKILGPIEVRGPNGTPIALGRRKQRVLLAALLLNVGTAISSQRMLDWLWHEQAPATAEANLYTYISALRRALGAPSRIETGSNGYVFRAAPGEVDVTVFEDLAAKGRQALADGREDVALDRLTRALGLWRGEAVLEGLPLPPPLRGETARLERLRATVVDASLEARLALGRHGEVLADLEALTRKDPLNERLTAQLMLALYRSGRRADALAVYQGARETLAAELGIDPGPDLIRMHRRILADNPALSLPRAVTGRRAFAPAELPIDSPAFTGRAAEKTRLWTSLTSAGPGAAVVIAITGPAGIGKSELAVHVAHRVANRFPDGRLYVNLHGSTPGAAPLKPADVLARLLRSLGDDTAVPADVDEAAARFRSLTDGKHLLLLLDNARDAAQVRPLLPASPTCRVVITGRRMLTSLDAVTHLRVGVMAEAEMFTLFGRLVGEQRVAADPWAARAIVRLCGGLPLAIRIVAARMIARPGLSPRALADRLAIEEHRLSELEADDRAIRASFMISYRALDDEGSRMFRLLSLLGRSDISVEVAAALADRSEAQTADLLDHLADAHLLEAAEPGWYRMHGLLRLFAREQARREETHDDEARAAQRALRGHLLIAGTVERIHPRRARPNTGFGGRAFRHFGLSTGLTADTARLDDELAGLTAAAHRAPRALGDGRPAAVGAPSHRPHGETALPGIRFGPFGEAGDAHDPVAALPRRTGDPVQAGQGYGGLAEAYRLAGRPDLAALWYYKALEADLAGGRGGTHRMAEHWRGLGQAFQDLGDDEQAKECWRTSTTILHALHLINGVEL